jgi:uncharacterized lipoprotein YbaY
MTDQGRARTRRTLIYSGGLIACVLAAACRSPSADQEARTASPGAPPTFVGKTWMSTDPSAAPGTLRIFLPDGTLVMDSCGETYRLARWRAIDDRRIEWQEDSARIEAEVTQVGSEQLQLRMQMVRELREENYRLASVPFVCPDARPSQVMPSVHVEGRLIYLERLALPRSAVVRVDLRDTSRADAPARILATQTIPTSQGPPFAFSLTVPDTALDPRASLSVFAEIRDGARLMFVTDTRHRVPREGVKGMEVRLTFVASARGDPARGVVTPSPTTYRCGNDTFKVAFEEQRAYVTMPDGSLVTLRRLDTGGDPEQPRTFSDGRMTFVREIEGTGGPRVLFARGRMVPAQCVAQR